MLISVLLFSVLHSLHAAELKSAFPDGTQVNIPAGNSYFTRKSRHNSKKNITRADAALLQKLLKASETFVLSKKIFNIYDSPAFAIVIRIASAPDKPEGYCGAGYEDYILLIKIDGHVARLQDSLLVQSCLKSISLVSDRGTTPQDAILPSDYPEIANFKSASPPDFEIKTQRIIVREGKLAIIE
ncbi:MAG: hypothetical protein QM581_05475 [Pseudomonas sp.]